MFFQEHQTPEVVAGSFQVQDECGAHDPEAAHQFSAHLRQGAKHMFDARTRRGDRAVTSLLRLGNAFGRMAPPLDVHAPTGLLQPGLPFDAGVASVGIDVATGVARIEQLFEDIGIGYGSMRDGNLADQLATLVDAGVQFVAKVILAVLSGPLRIDVLLCALVRFPIQSIAPSLTVPASSRLLRWTGACTSEASTI